MEVGKIIFLDIDGVLVSHDDLEINFDCLSEKKIQRLNKIIARTGAKCVLSSSKRILGIDKVLNDFLLPAGFEGEIISDTGKCFGKRCCEIKNWLKENTNYSEFIVIDDDQSAEVFYNRWIKTDMFDGGLLDIHVSQAINVLNGVPHVAPRFCLSCMEEKCVRC